jgi:hypothetical protein
MEHKYKIHYNKKNITSRPLASTNGEIYQTLRDIDFGFEIKRKEQNIILTLLKKNDNNEYIRLDDFDFSLSLDIFNNIDNIDTNECSKLRIIAPEKIIDDKTYNMTVNVSRYIESDKILYVITHPSFEINQT